MISSRGTLSTTKSGRQRRGIATLWLVLFLPLFVLLICLVVEIGNLWMARAELETALESAALAAVREWGEAGGGSTLVPRQVGQTVALANDVRGNPVVIGLNRTPAGPNNENTNLAFPPETANLIFGAITQFDPTVIFCPTVTPACGFGTVMLDVSSGASLQADNAWGFNFLAPNPTPNLTISQIVINLRAGTDADAIFDFGTDVPVISDNAPNLIDGSVVFQNDVAGLSNAPLTAMTAGTVTTYSNSQVAFVHDTALPHILTINFGAAMGDPGFEPGDRIRFGARVANLSSGNGNNDGDGVGLEGVQAAITFAIGGVNQIPIAVGTYADSNFRGTNTPSTLDPDSATNSAPFILPNSPANGNNNDGQSFVISSGGGAGSNAFAVRAEARMEITPVCGSLFGGMLGPYHVHAHSTAYYSCADRVPTVIRVDSVCP